MVRGGLRTGLRGLSALVAGLCASLLFAASPPVVELIADPSPVVPVVLKRGRLEARVALGFDRALLMNLAPAQRAGLKPFPLIGKFKVRTNLIPGGEALVRGNFITADVAGTGSGKIPAAWIDRDFVRPPAEGIVSVMAIDAPLVRIRQPVAPASTAVYELRRASRDEADMRLDLGGERIRVAFDLTAPATVMNARAAAALEAEGLVRRTGRVGLWSPVPGISLPIEALVPAGGARLLGLPLLAPAARITPERARELDARAAAGIAGAEAEQEDAITVTATRDGARPGGRRPWILIGADVLRWCPTIELDRAATLWRLACAFPPA